VRWVDGERPPQSSLETVSERKLPPVIEPVFTRWHVLGIAITVVIILWLWLAGNSHAEAFPVRVILSHVPTVSTFGPPQATGVALITFSEGDVRADFVDLPVLDSRDRYALWLRRSDTGETLLLGKFDASSLPVTHVDLLLPEPIPESGWDTVLVTVRTRAGPGSCAGSPVSFSSGRYREHRSSWTCCRRHCRRPALDQPALPPGN